MASVLCNSMQFNVSGMLKFEFRTTHATGLLLYTEHVFRRDQHSEIVGNYLKIFLQNFQLKMKIQVSVLKENGKLCVFLTRMFLEDSDCDG